MSDIHALSGAYAISALDDIERAQFERHLAKCAECRAEVESLREASAMLAETTAVEPPPTCAAAARRHQDRAPVAAGHAAPRSLLGGDWRRRCGHRRRHRWAHRWAHRWGHPLGPTGDHAEGAPEADTAAGGNVRRCVPAVASSVA